MVSLPVVVSDRDGKRITDLTKEDFQIFEDNVEQKIAGFETADEPVSIVLALDTSGSVAVRLWRIRMEAVRFVSSLHHGDSIAFITFGGDVWLREDLSSDREQTAYAIMGIRATGLTLLYDAIGLSLRQILGPVKDRKALVLFTDGLDTQSHMLTEQDTLALAKESNAPIYCIYFNTEGDWPAYGRRPPHIQGSIPPSPPSIHADYLRAHAYLNKLARSTGGLVLDALRTNNLGPVFEQVARELASLYSIGYYPTNQRHDGKFRSVVVKVKRPNLVVRTRPGYTIPLESKP